MAIKTSRTLSIEVRKQRAAAKLLKFFGKDGEKWTRGSLSADEDGDYAPFNSRKAVKFCLLGAIRKLRIGDEIKNAFNNQLYDERKTTIAGFNDSHGTYTHIRRFLENVAKGKAAKK